MSQLLSAIVFLAIFLTPTNFAQEFQHSQARDQYDESLYLKPLDDGKLYAHFEFATTYRKNIEHLKWEKTLQLVPKQIIYLQEATNARQLDFALTRGNWNYDRWGYPIVAHPTGAQIQAKFQHPSDYNLKRLARTLGSTFNAALSDVRFGITKLSINSSSSLERVVYANLPEETLCGANLKPLIKMLPCDSSAGLGALLKSEYLLKSSFSSIALNMQSTSDLQTRISLTVSVVFNPLTQFEGRQTWSIAKIFGNRLRHSCAPASSSRIAVDITKLDDINKLYPADKYTKSIQIMFGQTRTQANFDVTKLVNASNPSNLGIKEMKTFKQRPISERTKPLINLDTRISGHLAVDSQFIGTISNSGDSPVIVTYTHVLPEILYVYFHTIKVRAISGDTLNPQALSLSPANAKNLASIEIMMEVPAKSKITITYDFARNFLPWHAFKPDNHRGYIVGSAFLVISPQSNLAQIFTKPLTIILPTPDFSMPYNVLCIVGTVLVLAFGTLLNKTTRPHQLPVNQKLHKD